MHPQTQSPLFSLPQELRDMTYQLVFDGKIVVVEDCPLSEPEPLDGFILACKQTYYETVVLWYKTVTFEFDRFSWASNWFVEFIPNEHATVIEKAIIWIEGKHIDREVPEGDDVDEHYTSELVEEVGEYGTALQNINVVVNPWVDWGEHS